MPFHPAAAVWRAAESDTLIITDSFSCREQIAQSTERQALHVAQVIELARQAEKGEGKTAVFPEQQFAAPPAKLGLRTIGLALAGLLAALWLNLRRRT